MIELTGVTHHPAIEELVGVMCKKTQNTDQGFFRCEVAYFLGKMASSMRATIITKDRGDIPVNIYALALATSGYGKGYSVNIIEEELMGGFKKRFMEDTMPVISEQNHWAIATERAVRKNTDPAEEFDKVQKEYVRAGAYPFTFDSGTPEGIRQIRQKLLLANCGSINLQIGDGGRDVDDLGRQAVETVKILVTLAFGCSIAIGDLGDKVADLVEAARPKELQIGVGPGQQFDGASAAALQQLFAQLIGHTEHPHLGRWLGGAFQRRRRRLGHGLDALRRRGADVGRFTAFARRVRVTSRFCAHKPPFASDKTARTVLKPMPVRR